MLHVIDRVCFIFLLFIVTVRKIYVMDGRNLRRKVIKKRSFDSSVLSVSSILLVKAASTYFQGILLQQLLSIPRVYAHLYVLQNSILRDFSNNVCNIPVLCLYQPLFIHVSFSLLFFPIYRTSVISVYILICLQSWTYS